MKHVIVIGAGAAGMMAAIAAADSGAKVTLIEKNEKAGKKLFITGKGRCNVTNACDTEDLFANVCTNEKFLYSAFYTFDNKAVMDFLEKAGCRLKIERGDRVFPVSDHSSDVISAFLREINKRNIDILYRTVATEILTEAESEAREPEGNSGKRADQKVSGVKLADGRKLQADSVIVCTGGKSYPVTGSDGAGYRMAEDTGHRVVEPMPALVPLNCSEEWCKELMGLSLRNVSLTLVKGKKELYSGFGEMLFTHFGITGPLVLSASSYYVKHKDKGHEPAYVYIDLKPALDMQQLDKRLIRDFEENKNKQFKNALGGLFPAKLIPVMVSLSGISPEKKVNEISKSERQGFAELIKKLPLRVTEARSFAEAIITQGGVSVRDVNPSTMESKKVNGLFFAGEVLDLDAMTGGFNLQIAWSTGYLAGQNA